VFNFDKRIQVVMLFCRILPHSIVDETTAVCLFVSDVDRNDRDYSVTVDKYRDLLDQASVRPQIDVSTIYDFSILKSLHIAIVGVFFTD